MSSIKEVYIVAPDLNHAYIDSDYYKTLLRVYLIKGHNDKNNAHEQQKTF